jgi:hypothetical protein
MKNLSNLVIASIVAITFTSTSYAADLNMPGFTGSVNSTMTSGFSMRMEDNDCKGLPGYNTGMNADTVSPTSLTFLSMNMNPQQAQMGNDLAPLLRNISSKNGAGCAKSEKDGYGNTSYNPLRFGNQNADDGKMNFPDEGNIIDATQKVFTELSGYTDGGIGINLSFIGSVNPVLDINSEAFRKLTSEAEDQLVSDISLIDAYMTTSFDTPSSYVDVSLGRMATSYGEATFLPIGMNGFVTAGLDLTKLRAPGASIRDAIIPTEQIVTSFQAGPWGVEAYYQFGHDPIQFDPKGSFFGSDVIGKGAKNVLASGGWYEGDWGEDQLCSYAYNAIELKNLSGLHGCNAASMAQHTSTETRHLYNTLNLARVAQVGSNDTQWGTYAVVGGGATYQSAIQAGGGSVNLPGYDSQGLLGKFSSSAVDSQSLDTEVYTGDNLSPSDYNTGATVALEFANEKFKDPSDGHDFGFSAHTYLDDVGSGVDIGVYFANYTSKIPYAQVIGKGGVLAGDHVGMYKAQVGDYLGLDGAAGHSSGMDIITGNRVTDARISGAAGSAGAAWLALANGAYGAGVAGGFTAISGLFDAFRKDGGNNTAAANSTNNYIAKNFIRQSLFGSVITQENGRSKVFHNAALSVSGAASAYTDAGSGLDTGTDAAFLSYGATLLPAITPLNLAQVQFVYPEDNQIVGASFNTNVSGTTVQGEVTLRPNFKLSTGLGDQINQISDASGASLALTLFAIESGQTTMHDAVKFQTLEAAVNAVVPGKGINSGMHTLVQGIERSSLPNITYKATANGWGNKFDDYRSDAWITYDTWSFDLGTTTSFSPSSNVVQGLGADSAFLLTELGAVYIKGLNDRENGFVARNGFNEGAGEYLCLGIFQDLSDAQRAQISTIMKANGYSNFNIDYNLMEVGTYRKRATSNSSHARSGQFLTAGQFLDAGDVIFSKGAATGVITDTEGTNYHSKVTNNASTTNIGAGIVDAIFGNGNYCESQMGADKLAMTYRVVGGATYNNLNNSRWSMSPNFAWAHDFYGYGPSSLGGFVPGKQSLSLGLNFDKGDGLRLGLNYVSQLGEITENTGTDRDYFSANISYAF